MQRLYQMVHKFGSRQEMDKLSMEVLIKPRAPLILKLALTVNDRINDMKTLTDQQAYAAMYYFLKQIWERTKSDDLGGILGDLSVLPDGTPADPAVPKDWNRAIEYALNSGKPDSLKLQ
jgi:hypothetical protein